MSGVSGQERPRVAVIGAGVGGIAMAVNLVKAGLDSFTVFEQSAGPGGVWWDNTYPGCEVDIHSHFYSFSFMPFDWSRTHAKQPELLEYCNAVIDHFGVRDRFRFGTAVQRATWVEARQHYVVDLANGESEVFDAVVSCVGLMTTPNYPQWDGLAEFAGSSFHTARWDHDIDLRGKRVGYVGTGSTSAQVVPSIAPDADQLYVFQREPGWMIPKADRDFTTEERARYVGSRRNRLRSRYEWFSATAKLVRGQLAGKVDETEALRQMALRHLEDTVPDPELRAELTPHYAFGCKRTVRDSQTNSYLAALTRDNVTLVPHAVQTATPGGLVAAGVEYDLDVVIFGTGFVPQNFLPTIEVYGDRGSSIHDAWGESPSALVGSTVPGFPNFFMVGGPNSAGGGSIIYQNERSAELAVRLIKKIKPGRRSVVTRDKVFRRYVEGLHRTLDTKMGFQRECNNYYFASDGRNVFHYPGTHLQWHIATLWWPLLGVTTRRKAASASATAEDATQVAGING